MKSAWRYELPKTKSTESLAEYLFTQIVKHGVIILKEVANVARKKESLISSHILCLRFEHKMENGNRLLKVNSLY